LRTSDRTIHHLTVPVPTGGLIKLLEKYAADVNLYADLSREGEGVEGVTVFLTGKRPTVRVARELYVDPIRSHRCRYALAHEYGHVYLHAPAWRRRWMSNEEVRRCSGNKVLTLDIGFD
jgi:hypothetical protein